MERLNIMIILGTRPEIIKLSEVIKELDRHVNLTLVHTGQNFDYELNEQFFEQLEIRNPDYYLNAKRGSPSETIADIITKSDELFSKNKPDALLVYGDTNSCLCVIAAKKRKIPIFHMEAGNRCFDYRVPEEINRKIVDHLSDINLPLSEHARDYLIAEGIKPNTVIKTGSPMLEVLNANMRKILSSDVLKRENLKSKNFILVSVHREENIEYQDSFNDLLESIDELSRKFKMPIIVSTHPRTEKKLKEISYQNNNTSLIFSKPFGFHDYVNLQLNAFCIISDSGTITEESSILNIPAVTIRQSHERPEGMDESVLIMSGLKKQRVLDAVGVVTKHHNENTKVVSPVYDYQVDNVSKKVLRIIISYVDYVNRNVWHKEK